MSTKSETKSEAPAKASPQSRVRKPLILTKRQQQRRVVTDTKDRQAALQKQHTAAFKAQHKAD